MKFKKNKLALAVILSFALPVWADEIQTTSNTNLVTPGTFNFAIPLTIAY